MLDLFFKTVHAQILSSGNDGKNVDKISTFFENILEKIPGWIAGAIVIFLTLWTAFLAKKLVILRASQHIEAENQAILTLIGKVTYLSVLLIGLMIGLSFWGIQLDALLAAFGIGVAFALRDIMTNFIAGVLILVSRQFKIGDFIKVGSNIKGKVVEIQSRATILKGFDGTKIIVPNKDIFNKEVISFTTNPFRRITINVGVDYRTKLDNAVDVLKQIIEKSRKIIKEPKPSINIVSFGASGISINVKFWVDSSAPWLKIKSQLIKDIHESFKKAKITIPWPIRTIVYDKDNPALEGDFIKPIIKDNPSSPAANIKISNTLPTQNIQIEKTITTPKNTISAPLPPAEDNGSSFLKKN